jgi:hypothetical protein
LFNFSSMGKKQAALLDSCKFSVRASCSHPSLLVVASGLQYVCLRMLPSFPNLLQLSPSTSSALDYRSWLEFMFFSVTKSPISPSLPSHDYSIESLINTVDAVLCAWRVFISLAPPQLAQFSSSSPHTDAFSSLTALTTALITRVQALLSPFLSHPPPVQPSTQHAAALRSLMGNLLAPRINSNETAINAPCWLYCHPCRSSTSSMHSSIYLAALICHVIALYTASPVSSQTAVVASYSQLFASFQSAATRIQQFVS